MPDKAPWITYRPQLKVLDCTIRDGGLVNDSRFTDEFVRAVYEACLDAGIDYMEIGYKNSPAIFPPSQFGPWRHCHEEDIRRVVGAHDSQSTGLKLSVMADAGGKSDWKNQIIPKDKSVIDTIRVACYVNQIPEAVAMIEHAHRLGYETTCNIMAISAAQDVEIDQALEVLRTTPVGTVVVVDSYGSLYREQIDNLVTKYQKALEGTGKEVGIHAHNNLQLALANSIEAIILGVNRVDASMMGLGRGAGNCPMELLLGFLRNPKFKLRPIMKVLQEQLLPLQKTHEWGPYPQYNLTGHYNLHPRLAIKARSGPDRDNYLGFIDQILTDI